jgi:hypothetical protein
MARDGKESPLHHTQRMQQRLEEIVVRLCSDIETVDEPRFRAMLETSAEVIGGLAKAFRDCEQKTENAWR